MRVYGHRGAMGEAPESTLPGFRHAMAIGLDAVEFDVQLTADDQLVVIHDGTVDRTTNGSGPVSSFTLGELQALDASADFPGWHEPCRVPTLDEVLEVVGGLASLLVEIKRDTPARIGRVVPQTVAALEERGIGNRVIISSFDPYALEIAARVAPGIPRMINGAWREPDTRERALSARCAWADFDYHQAGQEHIDWARQHGMSVIGWPCNTSEDLQVLLAFGVDTVGSDQPGGMLRLLRAS